jgi:Na+-transporting NADH:ubiquinone oxidoreductase subunit C
MKLSLKCVLGDWQLKDNLYTLVFALFLGAVCALLLTAAADLTSPYRKANAKADEILNVLNVLKVPIPGNGTSKELIEIFNSNILLQSREGFAFYTYTPKDNQNKAQAFAIQFSGRGLWGPIKGFLALEADMKTIRGITFYQQEETPGLGGEIASPWFEQQFVGKSIVNEQGQPGIIVTRGGNQLGSNTVDAITGATMTCDKVQSLLNVAITKIIKEL